jgi:hypothetical protein
MDMEKLKKMQQSVRIGELNRSVLAYELQSLRAIAAAKAPLPSAFILNRANPILRVRIKYLFHGFCEHDPFLAIYLA